MLLALLVALLPLARARAATPWAPGEVLVQLTPAAARAAPGGELEALHAEWGVVSQEPLVPAGRRRPKTAGSGGVVDWMRLTAGGPIDVQAAATAYARAPGVLQAQPNYLRRPAEMAGDSLRARQWALDAIGWSAELAGEGGGVLVAVVDSGVDFMHPDLAGQIWHNPAEMGGVEGVDDDGNGYVDDEGGWDFADAPGLPGVGDYLERDNDPADQSGHGTHVAGIIAAAVNGRGVSGVAPAARLMIVRAGFNLASGAFLEDDDLAAAVVYAADNGARVINMSWGDPAFSPLLRDAARYGRAAGCVLVAAAGNEGTGGAFYPAHLDETIAVAAAGTAGDRAGFSNWGPAVDLAAPGVAILGLAPGGGYVERSGTSMAAAHVSGLAALVLARQGGLSADQIRGALLATCRPTAEADWDPGVGAGLARVEARQVAAPPVVQISEPETGAALSAPAVTVRAVLAGVEGAELSWGRGAAPSRWLPLVPTPAAPAQAAQAEWSLAGLESGVYQVRARGRVGGRSVEDHVEVVVNPGRATATGVRAYRALDGAEWVGVVEWQTPSPSEGWVTVRQGGAVVARVPASPRRTDHQVKLPAELGPGTYEISVEPQSGPLPSDPVPAGTVPVVEPGPAWTFSVLDTLAAGYLLPRPADLDGDGRPELATMPFGSGQYNPAAFHRLEGGRLVRAHVSSHLYIPWATGDLDGDGLAEVLAADARRVRLLEAERAGEYPRRLIWEGEGVWGGEVGDVDGDGRGEMVLRSESLSFLQVVESVGNDRFAEAAVLTNPTAQIPKGSTGPEANRLGQRLVVADLDGDGRPEVLAGDGDGDLFAYEGVADNQFRSSWREIDSRPDVDARLVGGGIDLDGDGRPEFVAARLLQPFYEVQRARWEVKVYQATGDDAFAPEWQSEVLGGGAGGEGVAAGDLDGDGTPELVLALAPDLYVLRATAPDTYESVWHTATGPAHQPAVGDLDGDGTAELAFNGRSAMQVVSRRRPPAGLEAPAGFDVRPLDAGAVLLEWQALPGVAAYRVWRDGAVVASRLENRQYRDAGLAAGQVYRYAVAGLADDGTEGVQSAEREVRPEAAPRLLSSVRSGPRHLALLFDTALQVPEGQAYRLRLDPGGRSPSSAVLDRGDRRLVLGFDEPLPDSLAGTLQVGVLRSRQGTPLAAPELAVSIGPPEDRTVPVTALPLSATQIEVRFSGPVAVPPFPAQSLRIEPGPLRVARVQGTPVGLLLELDTATPLRPAGLRYEVVFTGLEDAAGRPVNGSLTLRYAAPDLASVRPFPNPYRPASGPLTFAYLTPQAAVRIYDASGQLVRALGEEDGDGGIAWDGANQAGEPLASGIYYYVVVGAGQRVRGRLALVRD
ncbi:MAG: S8 family serine peptidase [Candidatus Latescibacterota bacterium]